MCDNPRMITSSAVKSPLPTPVFEPQSFSTKKQRQTPKSRPPPKPTIKCLSASRVFVNQGLSSSVSKVQPVTFKPSKSDSSLLSSHYDSSHQGSYFEQCFIIESKIGSGSFGEVYRVRSKDDGQLYAVKRSREKFKGKSDRKRKLEEVKKHEQLPKHPNCVQFYKAWEEQNHYYIQLELCKKTLSEFSDSNHDVPEALVWKYLVDLLLAVQHLHKHNLVHMDIKPDNIFLSTDGTCKLGDFGLGDTSDVIEGDPKYLASECLQGLFSKAADIFSLGMTFLELASDLDVPSGGDLWHELRQGQIPDPLCKRLSIEQKEVLELMLTKDPILRPSAESLLAHPVVALYASRRRRQQLFCSVRNTFKQSFRVVRSWLSTLWSLLCYPLAYFLGREKNSDNTAAVSTPTTYKPPMDWDTFSDDEVFEHSHNSTLGAPLSDDTLESRPASFLHSHNLHELSHRSESPIHRPPSILSRSLRTSDSPLPQTPRLASARRFLNRDVDAEESRLLLERSARVRKELEGEDDILERVRRPRKPVSPRNLMSVFNASGSDSD